MKRLASVILILILNTSVLALFDSSVVYNSKDIETLQKIYNQNIDVLSSWNLSEPGNIDELEWEYDKNIYNLVSLDLSDTDITGKIDLSAFKNLENYSFADTEISEIILPCSITEIPKNAFQNCSVLEYINIPAAIHCISDSAFKNCTQLKSVIINSDDIKIDSYAFSGCVSLKCIVNANGITYIGRNAFFNCDNLMFYGSDILKSNPYLCNYLEKFGINYSTSVSGKATGYVGVMKNIKDKTINLSEHGKPFKYGTAYLYDEDGTLLLQSELNDSGCFNFDKLLIGYNYKLVIDGNTVIPRAETFVMENGNYVISPQDKAIPIVTCDFDKDGLITTTDMKSVLYCAADSSALTEMERVLYDLNGDGHISALDAKEVQIFLFYKNYY